MGDHIAQLAVFQRREPRIRLRPIWDFGVIVMPSLSTPSHVLLPKAFERLFNPGDERLCGSSEGAA
jgi:hypothetical protein